MKLRFEQLEQRCMLMAGTAGDDLFLAGPGWAILNGVEYADVVSFDGLGGNDVAHLYDTPGDDVFTARPGSAEFGKLSVTNCEVIHGYSKAGGSDTAFLTGSGGDDEFVGKGWSKLFGDGYYLRAKFFDKVEATAGEGTDLARLYDSEGNDVVHMRPDDVTIYLEDSQRVRGFDFVHAYAKNGGYDTAHLYGDQYTARETYTRMFGETNQGVNRAKYFEEVAANRVRVNAPSYQPVEGTITVLTGTHILRRAIELGSGDTLTGGTLTRPNRNQKEITQNVQEGATRLFVTDTTGYRVGDELGLYAYGTAPSWVIVADLSSDWIETEEPIVRSYPTADYAAIVNYFPLVRAIGTGITIDGVTLDGNHDLSTKQWQITGGGLIHMAATNSVIRNTTIVNAYSTGIFMTDGRDNIIEDTTVLRSRGHGILLNREIDTIVRRTTSSYSGYQITKNLGDGIMVNGGAGHLITDNITQFNARYGLHPASEIGVLTRGGVWEGNDSQWNRSNGYHFCYNNYGILVRNNVLSNNGRSGVGGLGLGGIYGDRFNIFTDNQARNNHRFGIETNGGRDNVITFNDVRDNRLGGVLVVGDHTIFGNIR